SSLIILSSSHKESEDRGNSINLLSKRNQQLLMENMELRCQIFALSNKVPENIPFSNEDVDKVDNFIIYSFAKKPKLEGEMLSTTHKVRRSAPARNRKAVD